MQHRVEHLSAAMSKAEGRRNSLSHSWRVLTATAPPRLGNDVATVETSGEGRNAPAVETVDSWMMFA